MGVSTCGNGSGYCLLGLDCTLDDDFVADTSGGHCRGLLTAFTPSAHFVCCRYAMDAAPEEADDADDVDDADATDQTEAAATVSITTAAPQHALPDVQKANGSAAATTTTKVEQNFVALNDKANIPGINFFVEPENRRDQEQRIHNTDTYSADQGSRINDFVEYFNTFLEKNTYMYDPADEYSQEMTTADQKPFVPEQHSNVAQPYFEINSRPGYVDNNEQAALRDDKLLFKIDRLVGQYLPLCCIADSDTNEEKGKSDEKFQAFGTQFLLQVGEKGRKKDGNGRERPMVHPCWMVFLQDIRNSNIICAGAVIANNVVLTTATCATRLLATGISYVGLIGINKQIRSVSIHEDFITSRNQQLKNNIGAVHTEMCSRVVDIQPGINHTFHIKCERSPENEEQVLAGSPLICEGILSGIAVHSEGDDVHFVAVTPYAIQQLSICQCYNDETQDGITSGSDCKTAAGGK
uniref:Mucin-22-like protein n=1 Tax=Locusta migratoria TaxID=7004 RepID=A0A7D5AW52_LOCMI|nr:mucin-22-like protein [Locusta migratoria]